MHPPSNQRTAIARPDDNAIEYSHPAASQIGNWLRKLILTNDPKRGPCTHLIVRHFSVNKKPNGDVEQIEVDNKYLVANPGAIDALVDEACQVAQRDANSLQSGIQLYGVFAYFQNNPNFAPRCWLRIATEDLDPDAGGADPSEPPTAQGQVAQAQRHVEAMMRMSVMNTSYLIDALRKENSDQRGLLGRQMQQSIEFMAMMQETLDNSSQRRIEERNSEIKQEALSGVFEHLKLLIPTLMNKIAGQKIAAETDPSFVTLAALFESLSAEQQEALVTKFLTPTQTILFGEFLETYEKRKNQLTSASAPGGALKLPALFDKRSDLVKATRPPTDEKAARLEKHAQNFMDAFKGLKFDGPVKPASNT